jgi:hypothetical protein
MTVIVWVALEYSLSWEDRSVPSLNRIATFPLMRGQVCPLSEVLVPVIYTCLLYVQIYKFSIQLLNFLCYIYTIWSIYSLCNSLICQEYYAISCSAYVITAALVTWTVESLITITFKSHTFPVSGFILSYVANIWIYTIFYDFCFLPA